MIANKGKGPFFSSFISLQIHVIANCIIIATAARSSNEKDPKQRF
jgi:hypothetical protein